MSSPLVSLFTTGRIYTERLISLAGPAVANPRLVRTTRGADLTELTKVNSTATITVSFQALFYQVAQLLVLRHFLGRFHNQVSVLTEGRERPALHFFLHQGQIVFQNCQFIFHSFFKGKKIQFYDQYQRLASCHGANRFI